LAYHPSENNVMSPQSRRQRTVLLVEDDELVSDALTRILVREGYLVLTAGTGHDAIGLLRTPSTPIDLVVLDIGLPDVSGTNLCARFREFFPNLPVLVCTGAADPEEVRELRSMGISRFFSKPIAIEDLIKGVRTALAESTSSA
jgi:DNA-binding response OmpR family regulator